VQEEIDYDLPLSQEVKSPAYPQGPVCIYDPLVYLYLEPSNIEAREFDVVLNVAREVKNPFTVAAEEAAGQETQEGKMQVAMDTEVARFAGRDSNSEPQTASSEKTFSTAFEEQSDDATRSAPTTPKAWKPEPEYIHIPWDHNTNVVEDLLRLCELIDDRVRQEKRVLVHCQCGVSRSASLVVAYGLYKNPQLTVQEAYDAVKNRSRWIGPNMNLIYQLSEFKSKLPKRHGTGVSAWHSWRSLGIARSNPNALLDADMKNDLLSSSLRSPPQKSLSLPSQSVREPPVGRSNSFSPPGSAQLAPVITGNITPGPSSAPPDMQWSPGQAPKKFEADTKTADNKKVEDSLTPPRLMDAETDIVLSPSTMEREPIEEKGAAPAGGVANDLQEVARDLNDAQYMPSPEIPTPKAREADSTEHGLATLSPPSIANMSIRDAASSTTVAPAAKEPGLAPPPRPLRPMPSLPAGFSSLLSRRQGPLSQRQPPPRQELPRLVPVQLPQRLFDPDVPPTPSLLSPRAAEFTASPFHRTAAGDLAGSSVFEQGLMSPRAVEQDPRSPHHKGEAPITRSIFDMI
jgi:tyrosine-protein phosphatase